MENLSNSIYLPTLYPFKNGYVLGHKKSGSRFFELISMDNPKFPLKTDSKAINIYVTTDEFSFSINSSFETENTLGYFNSKFDFLNEMNQSSIEDLLLNPNKPIHFVIRNPLERFMSGLIQNLLSVAHSIRVEEKYHSFFEKSPIESSELRLFVKAINKVVDEEQLPSEEFTFIINKILNYLLHHNFNLFLSDIHTRNYLTFFLNLTNFIKDKEKIKIINLNQCNTKTALEYFNYLRGDFLLNNIYKEELGFQYNSNKLIYQSIINGCSNNFDTNQIIEYYLNDESFAYNILKNSKYVLDLKD